MTSVLFNARWILIFICLFGARDGTQGFLHAEHALCSPALPWAHPEISSLYVLLDDFTVPPWHHLPEVFRAVFVTFPASFLALTMSGILSLSHYSLVLYTNFKLSHLY